VKKSVPFAFTRLNGSDPAEPGRMSFTRTVPAAVPSLFHSSMPAWGVEAVKKAVAPITTV
jgi:hypothetical protein